MQRLHGYSAVVLCSVFPSFKLGTRQRMRQCQDGLFSWIQDCQREHSRVMSLSDLMQPFFSQKYCVVMTPAKMKSTASQTIHSTRSSYMISYFSSFLQPVRKHLSCLTARTKFSLLEFTPYELPETSVLSESSYALIGLNQKVVDRQS